MVMIVNRFLIMAKYPTIKHSHVSLDFRATGEYTHDDANLRQFLLNT